MSRSSLVASLLFVSCLLAAGTSVASNIVNSRTSSDLFSEQLYDTFLIFCSPFVPPYDLESCYIR